MKNARLKMRMEETEEEEVGRETRQLNFNTYTENLNENEKWPMF